MMTVGHSPREGGACGRCTQILYGGGSWCLTCCRGRLWPALGALAGTPGSRWCDNDFAGKYNTSYVLMKARDCHVSAKYVSTSYGDDYHWSIWVPKTLVTNKRGPIKKWVPKSKA